MINTVKNHTPLLPQSLLFPISARQLSSSLNYNSAKIFKCHSMSKFKSISSLKIVFEHCRTQQLEMRIFFICVVFLCFLTNSICLASFLDSGTMSFMYDYRFDCTSLSLVCCQRSQQKHWEKHIKHLARDQGANTYGLTCTTIAGFHKGCVWFGRHMA